MDEIKRLTPAQRAHCNRLIRRLCANYDGGNCLPLDDGEGCVCVQMISYSLLCTATLLAIVADFHFLVTVWTVFLLHRLTSDFFLAPTLYFTTTIPWLSPWKSFMHDIYARHEL